jgi:hypothetical protein
MAKKCGPGGIRERFTAMSERVRQRRSLPGRMLEVLETLEAIRANTQRIAEVLEERARTDPTT